MPSEGRCCGGRCNLEQPVDLSRREFLSRIAAGSAALSLAGQLGWADDERPDARFEWKLPNASTGYGAGPDCLYIVGAKSRTLQYCRWNSEGILERPAECSIADEGEFAFAVACGTESTVLVSKGNKRTKETGGAIVDLRNGRKLKEWRSEKSWYGEPSRSCHNGLFIGYFAIPDFSQPGFDFDGPEKLRVGIYSCKKKELEWITTLSGKVTDLSVKQVVPSDDGTLLAIAGWQYGAAVVDVATKKLLWERRLQDETCLEIIAFSADQKHVYAGGVDGKVYDLDVRSGEIRGHWSTAHSGNRKNRRISALSVSADGRFVATGTAPDGLVFVHSVRDATAPRVFSNGGSRILIASFSPDSSHLATYDGDHVRIWAMP